MKKFIRDFQEGELVTTFLVVISKVLKKTKEGKPYLDLLLGDASGTINAKIWDRVEELAPKCDPGKAVKVKGAVTVFNNELQLKIENIRLVEKDKDVADGYSEADLIPTTTKNVKRLWDDLLHQIQTIQNPYLRQVTEGLYREYEEKLQAYPGSMKLHHAYRGGLVEHIHAMATLADKVCGYYPELDRDLVLAGVLLHDIGKLIELSPGLITDYSDAGNFIGHIVLGHTLVHNACQRIPDFPEILRLKLEHIILAHQGHFEWQSPREPQLLEALVVYYLDELDTRINQMQKDISEDGSSGNWTARQGYFKRPLYKGEKPSE